LDVAIRQATVDDLQLLETIVPPLRARRFAAKIAAGEVRFIAIKENSVVAFVFAGYSHTPSTEQAGLKLEPTEAYLWAGYAVPQYRRQGLVRAVNLSLCRFLQGNGYDTVLLQLDDRNKASLGHCRRMGYRVTHRVTYLRVLGWRVCRHTPVGGSD
jgi:ribosomal protein S18 acetylase RimI-like enzyme